MSISQNLRIKFRQAKLVCKALCKRPDPLVPTVLMYHSVSDDSRAEYVWPPVRVSLESFDQDLKYIASNYDVISIDDYIESIHKGSSLPRRSVIISFDDGYLDNLENAIPMLKSYGMPGIVYLATKYIDTAEPQWIDSLHSMMKFRTRHRIVIDTISDRTWDLLDHSEFGVVFSKINQALVSKTHAERHKILQQLNRQLQPEYDMPRLTLNWGEVQNIAREFSNVTLGLHTDQHLDLRNHPLELKNEMSLSQQKLKQATGVEARHFSYPYGRSFQGASTTLAEFGMQTAVCSTPDYEVDSQNLQYHVSRIDAVRFSRRQWWYAD